MAHACSARRAFLGLGSNLGDRRGNLERVLALIGEISRVHLSRHSTWHETAPVGGPPGQGAFLNGVCEVVTTLPPEELFARTQEIEAQLGRVREERDGPRTIDIDLLWYEGATRSDETLSLPHPRWEERAFVLAPLAEFAPDFVLPECGETVAQRAAALGAGEVVA
jgi:2-amino-4-hydroxy-6-hydroxymethyldihydropteridine diphosphokinase